MNMGFLDIFKEPGKKEEDIDYCTCIEICPKCGKPIKPKKSKYNPITGFD